MERAFVDTSAWFAHVYQDDPDHEPVARELLSREGRLVTSTYVFDEAVTLVRRKIGHAVAVRLGEALRDPHTCHLHRPTPADEQAAWAIFVRRRDQEYSFTDCLSFAIMRRLGLRQAIALDDDFRREGFEVAPA